ncbi:MAG: DUF481 domain-containing protein [Chlorobi bacterium]|nr:DUF481 domain-containing protein [Chlorobiota bacterium]
MKKLLSLILFTLSLVSVPLSAQTDTLITKNGQTLIGEIKKLSQGVIHLKTDYSKSDFEIKWKKIKAIYSPRFFTITLSDRMRLLGRINGKTDSLIIITKYNNQIATDAEHVVRLDKFNDNIFKRFSASFSLGLNLAKANNLRQFTMRSALGYFTKDWRSSASFDMVFNEQDEIDRTKRIDAQVSYNYFLKYQWFLFASADFLQNEEQKLKLRTTPKIGLGNYIFQSNRAYLSVAGGIALNIETYIDPNITGRNNAEGFLTSELNMFDFGDVDILSTISIYKSFDSKKRIRTDFKFDLKYDLPYDIFIKMGFTINYDTEPVKGASVSDYVIQTTLGWELD